MSASLTALPVGHPTAAAVPQLKKADPKPTLLHQLKLHNNSDIMHRYVYSTLSQRDSTRLLQLLPRKDDPKNLRCKLLEYPLRDSNNSSHPYEALSYVWGSEDTPQSIVIDDRNLSITQNLYTVLLRLQNYSLSRILWVDAVCINQADEAEKEHQIPLMAEIYAKASRVLVWLGEAGEDGDEALKAIHHTGKNAKDLSHAESNRHRILKLLQRPWFQRIWVREQTSKLRVGVTE
jgi:hypothetical protein